MKLEEGLEGGVGVGEKSDSITRSKKKKFILLSSLVLYWRNKRY